MSDHPDLRPEPGRIIHIGTDLRRILAPNPSPMTHWGTNTFLIGRGDVAVIDPGPDNNDHLEAILAALAPGERITHIFVTHSHLDHSPLARPLARACGAPVLGFGPYDAGRSALMRNLAEQGSLAGGEGIDTEFRPDIALADGETIDGDSWSITAIHTPGHMANHLCFKRKNAVFTGDHVMGWASTLISPPDGDMAQYMASLDRLAALGAARFYPAHGLAVDNPSGRLAELIAHRRGRESAILEALLQRPGNATELAARLYTDTPRALLGAAARNVLAHLLDLTARGLTETSEVTGTESVFSLTKAPSEM
jgi:glyoxylase-like metal-dependent hydrolase (beta-lactamase superfamily II)